MTDISLFDQNSPSNPNDNIFGLPFEEDESRLIILPVPWEVTVSGNAGTARAAEHVFKAALQVDLFDADHPDCWKQGFFIRETDRKILMKSDYLRKEAELYIDYISQGEDVNKNQFMCKSLREINEGSVFLNNWVYEKSKEILDKGKLLVLLGGDHSTALGYFKAAAEQFGNFGILQIDAHCDLRKSYEGFNYSHASIMYNALTEIPEITHLVQAGIRDYCKEEKDYIDANPHRVHTFFDKDIKERQYEGISWKMISQEIIAKLPSQVFLSLDIDGLDPKLCPNTGTPVHGGFEAEEIIYLLKQIIRSGRKLIGFDISEIGISETDWDANVGARLLYRMCNLLVSSNPATA
ncbi:MAG: hypothetical protein RL732_504 [Bacteroidota bacterium]|jgi:agmatinase